MTPEIGSIESDGRDDHEVVAAIDDEGGRERLIIADITRDDGWLAVATTEAAALAEWR